MQVTELREWLLEGLSLPANCIVYPPATQESGLRPDFVVVAPDREIKGWTEVELGPENGAQMAAFRKKFQPAPVESIVGRIADKVADKGDISLEEISEFVNHSLPGLDAQQLMNASLFSTLVAKAVSEHATVLSYDQPTDALLMAPLIVALRSRLGDQLQAGTPPVQPGTALISTLSQRGWTIRVFSKVSSSGSVSLYGLPRDTPLLCVCHL